MVLHFLFIGGKPIYECFECGVGATVEYPDSLQSKRLAWTVLSAVPAVF